LPTPLEEGKQEPVVKEEPSRPPVDTRDCTEVSGYDSDIPMFFGDEEISEFCAITESSTSIAKTYLLRADGDTNNAVMAFLTDQEADCVRVEPEESSRNRKTRQRIRSKKPIVIDSDDDGDGDDLTPVSEIFRPGNAIFSEVIPRDDTIDAVRDLVADIRPSDLHATINDIAERVADEDLDPATQFIECETLENCAAYWKAYLAYTEYIQYLFVRATKRPTARNLERIHNAENFKKFHDQLLTYLNVKAPQPASKRDILVRGHSPESELESTLPQQSGKKQKKGKKQKIKPVKPIKFKPAEQRFQELELKRIADREKDQKRRGNYTTTAADGSILVNHLKEESDVAVCLHPKLAATMKEHQIEGLRFMWTQVASFNLVLILGYYDYKREGMSPGAHHGARKDSANYRLPHYIVTCSIRCQIGYA
jgi:hypothetical protein